jgi:pilus assembly protein CpaB
VTFHADQGKDPMTTTVLQNIDVLSTGERLEPDPSGKPEHVKVVTLLMTPDDAQKLLLASNQGTVQFALRNAADQDQTAHRPALMRELQGMGSAPTPASKVIRTVAAAPKTTVYEVEVFDGTKKSIQKF